MQDILVKVVIALFGAFFTVELIPIKLSPLRWLGNRINSSIKEELNNVMSELKEIKKDADENEMDRIRYEILDFANSCRNKEEHTKDEFLHIIDINTKYHVLTERNEIQNGVLDAEYSYILKVYMKCLDSGAFFSEK